MGRKRKVDLPDNFSSLKVRDTSRVRTFVTEEEKIKMRELRSLGLSYQKIAETLGRSKIAVMYHLKDREWVEGVLGRNRRRSREWYRDRGKSWKHDYYERKKELYDRGELE